MQFGVYACHLRSYYCLLSYGVGSGGVPPGSVQVGCRSWIAEKESRKKGKGKKKAKAPGEVDSDAQVARCKLSNKTSTHVHKLP